MNKKISLLIAGAAILASAMTAGVFLLADNKQKVQQQMSADASANLSAQSAVRTSANRYYPNTESAGGWRKNTEPEFVRSLGLDPQNLYEMALWNQGILKRGRKESMLVIKDGWIVSEWYDDIRDMYVPSKVASVAKSVVAVLLGIAFNEYNTKIAAVQNRAELNVDSKLYSPDWFPQAYPLSDPRKEKITFHHVLNHTSGFTPEEDVDGNVLEFNRNTWDVYTDWLYGFDLPKSNAQLFFDPASPEGNNIVENWGKHKGAYSSIGFAHLGVFIQNALDTPVEEYLKTRLFDRIGVKHYQVYNHHASHRNRSVYNWFSGSDLDIIPRDLARFAYLFLSEGRWGRTNPDGSFEEKQIVPAAWLSMFTEDIQYQNIRSNHDGYFGEQYPKDMIRFYGAGANLVFIVPSMDLIAIRTSRAHEDLFDPIQETFLQKLFDSVISEN